LKLISSQRLQKLIVLCLSPFSAENLLQRIVEVCGDALSGLAGFIDKQALSATSGYA
jgi:hypothetical protein